MRKLCINQVKARLPEHVNIVESTYTKTTARAIFVDKQYGEWSSIVDNVLRGRGHPIRGRKKCDKSRSFTAKEISSRLPSHITMKKETFVGVRHKATFVDSIHGEWTTWVNDILRGQNHPKRFNRNSIGQLQMEAFIRNLGFITETSIKIPNCKKEIDIYIPELKLGIEYNGKHWHSGPDNELKMLNKKLLAEQEGIKLLHIWDYEWLKQNTKTKLSIIKELSL